MPYTFDGMMDFFPDKGEPHPLSRKMHDDVWACRHCGSKETTTYTTPMHALVRNGVYTNRDEKQVNCKKCGKRLEYLEDRWYGLTAKELAKRDKTQRSHLKPWGNNPPLWAIGDSDG